MFHGNNSSRPRSGSLSDGDPPTLEEMLMEELESPEFPNCRPAYRSRRQEKALVKIKLRSFLRFSEIPESTEEILNNYVENVSAPYDWDKWYARWDDKRKYPRMKGYQPIRHQPVRVLDDRNNSLPRVKNRKTIGLEKPYPEKAFVDKGLYAASTPSYQTRFQFPLPCASGLDFINKQRDFKVPYDIFCPSGDLMPPNWKPMHNNFWGNLTPNAGVDAPVGQCSCNGQCGSGCWNKAMLIECDDNTCSCTEVANCHNRPFARYDRAIALKRRYLIGYEIFETAEKGYGLRTIRSFSRGELIIEYTGDVIAVDEVNERSTADYQNSKNHYLLHINNNFIIDGSERGSPARFVNHSCNPNSEMEKWSVSCMPRLGLFAKKKIPAGTEITYDYNFSWFDKTKATTRICNCKSSNCRGFITGRPTKGSRARGVPVDSSTQVSESSMEPPLVGDLDSANSQLSSPLNATTTSPISVNGDEVPALNESVASLLTNGSNNAQKSVRKVQNDGLLPINPVLPNLKSVYSKKRKGKKPVSSPANGEITAGKSCSTLILELPQSSLSPNYNYISGSDRGDGMVPDQSEGYYSDNYLITGTETFQTPFSRSPTKRDETPKPDNVSLDEYESFPPVHERLHPVRRQSQFPSSQPTSPIKILEIMVTDPDPDPDVLVVSSNASSGLANPELFVTGNSIASKVPEIKIERQPLDLSGSTPAPSSSALESSPIRSISNVDLTIEQRQRQRLRLASYLPSIITHVNRMSTSLPSPFEILEPDLQEEEEEEGEVVVLRQEIERESTGGNDYEDSVSFRSRRRHSTSYKNPKIHDHFDPFDVNVKMMSFQDGGRDLSANRDVNMSSANAIRSDSEVPVSNSNQTYEDKDEDEDEDEDEDDAIPAPSRKRHPIIEDDEDERNSKESIDPIDFEGTNEGSNEPATLDIYSSEEEEEESISLDVLNENDKNEEYIESEVEDDDEEYHDSDVLDDSDESGSQDGNEIGAEYEEEKEVITADSVDEDEESLTLGTADGTVDGTVEEEDSSSLDVSMIDVVTDSTPDASVGSKHERKSNDEAEKDTVDISSNEKYKGKNDDESEEDSEDIIAVIVKHKDKSVKEDKENDDYEQIDDDDLLIADLVDVSDDVCSSDFEANYIDSSSVEIKFGDKDFQDADVTAVEGPMKDPIVEQERKNVRGQYIRFLKEANYDGSNRRSMIILAEEPDPIINARGIGRFAAMVANISDASQSNSNKPDNNVNNKNMGLKNIGNWNRLFDKSSPDSSRLSSEDREIELVRSLCEIPVVAQPGRPVRSFNRWLEEPNTATSKNLNSQWLEKLSTVSEGLDDISDITDSSEAENHPTEAYMECSQENDEPKAKRPRTEPSSNLGGTVWTVFKDLAQLGRCPQ